MNEILEQRKVFFFFCKDMKCDSSRVRSHAVLCFSIYSKPVTKTLPRNWNNSSSKPTSWSCLCPVGHISWVLCSAVAEAAAWEASCPSLMSLSKWQRLSDRLRFATPRVKSSQVCLWSPTSRRVSPKVSQCLLTHHRQDLREDREKVTEEVYWVQ